MDGIAAEVNETLKEEGRVHLPEVTKKFDLPADFLIAVCFTRLNN